MNDICPCCHARLQVVRQSALLPGRPDYELGTCFTPDCVLRHVTLTLGSHWQLSAEQVAQYAATNARLSASRAAFLAVSP